MKRWFAAIPGPIPVKVLVVALVALVGLVALFFAYDWIGSNLLDTGGTVG